MAFEQVVATPNFGLAVAPAVDTSWIAKLPDDYFRGQQQQKQLAVQNAFKDGLPTDASGNVDYNAAADRLIRLGALDQGQALLNTGLQRQGIMAAQQAGAQLANGGIAPTSTGGATGPMSSYGNAISSIESGGNYSATGPVTKTGDQALGKYQVMASNVPQWTAEVLGKSMTPQEFLANPQAQDAVFNAKFGQSLKQYGNPQDAASVWFTGKPYAQGAGAHDQLGTSGSGYVGRFMAALPGSGQGGPPPVNVRGGQQPVQVASSGGYAPSPASPAGSPQVPPQPQPASAPAVPLATANTPVSRFATVRQIAQSVKRDPQAVADALGVDPDEQVDTADTGVRQMLAGALGKTGIIAPYGTAAATPLAGTAVSGPAPTSDGHPYGPKPSAPVATASAAPMPPTQAPQQQPAPVAAPQSNAQVGDPSMGGLVPPAFQSNPGGYVAALRGKAVQLAALPGGEHAAQGFNKMADAIETGIARSNITTTEMKNYQEAVKQGYQGTMLDFERDQAKNKSMGEVEAQNSTLAIRGAGQKAEATAAGTAQGSAPYDLVPTQPTPGGPTVFVPKSSILNGDGSTSAVKEQPAVFGEKQKAMATEEAGMVDARQQRAVAQERLDAMARLLETYQTGAGADVKAAAIANARALGLNLPDSATANPAAVEQFAKNATANIFSQAKSLGGKILVSELAGLQKSNANPNMQPGANAAIIAQQKGILNWQDAHDSAYTAWKQANPYAYDASKFEQDFIKDNPVSKFVSDARKEIAPLGVPLPPKNQLVDGQAYIVKGQKARWSAAANGFVPVASP